MKKRLLAGLLSFTMIAGQIMPVVAADDAEVTVSEEVVVTDGEEEDVVSVQDGTEMPGEETDFTEVEEISDEDVTDEAEGETFYNVAEFDGAEDIEAAEVEILEAAASHIYSGSQLTYTYTVADNVEINGGIYNATTVISYNSEISYRGRKIKAESDLNAKISSSGLYKLASDLVTISGTGIDPKDVIKVKFTTKKNKNANSGSYFTAKFSVNTSIAKKLGIKGKSLKTLKKAVKQVNKVSKSKENRVSFNITQLNVNQLLSEGNFTGIGTYRGWILGTFQGFSHFRARLDADQPETVNQKTYTKWTRIDKSDFTVTKVKKEGGYVYFTVTPKGKNFTGVQFDMKFRTTSGF